MVNYVDRSGAELSYWPSTSHWLLKVSGWRLRAVRHNKQLGGDWRLHDSLLWWIYLLLYYGLFIWTVFGKYTKSNIPPCLTDTYSLTLLLCSVLSISAMAKQILAGNRWPPPSCYYRLLVLLVVRPSIVSSFHDSGQWLHSKLVGNAGRFARRHQSSNNNERNRLKNQLIRRPDRLWMGHLEVKAKLFAGVWLLK